MTPPNPSPVSANPVEAVDPAGWLADDLALALSLADAADRITLSRFQAVDLHVESKPDNTPVSDADTAVESMIRERLATARPGDGVLGEEEGLVGENTRRRWILDPVDGTKNFVRGVPVWGTLLGLEVDGEMVVGVASAPAMSRRWWAARGTGAFTRDATGDTRSLQVSSVARLSDAFLSFASLEGWRTADRLPQLLSLAEQIWRSRAYGDFWSHMMVAEGAVDLACEPEVSLWDLAALQVIVEEAGGRFTDLRGRRGPGWGTILTTNGHLHDVALSHFRD
ncbi:histidinol-phosphatase [Parafrankia soli]|uniref:Histidinol-phosphatase n=1 Tax=Parafrankia soli TaxID=2599596 RepID=A0A1S1RM71_9ACTN|nr:histidinol-phosphatase [Parafrankia soli]OHV46911.1 histidinol-phosphatase [Parafrankia soli]